MHVAYAGLVLLLAGLGWHGRSVRSVPEQLTVAAFATRRRAARESINHDDTSAPSGGHSALALDHAGRSASALRPAGRSLCMLTRSNPILGPVAAVAAYRASCRPAIRGSQWASLGKVMIMPSFLAAIYAMEASILMVLWAEGASSLIATTGHGLTDARCGPDGRRMVDAVLEDMEVRYPAVSPSIIGGGSMWCRRSALPSPESAGCLRTRGLEIDACMTPQHVWQNRSRSHRTRARRTSDRGTGISVWVAREHANGTLDTTRGW